MNPGLLQDVGGFDAYGFAARFELGDEAGCRMVSVHGPQKCRINAALPRAFMQLFATETSSHVAGAMETPEIIRAWLIDSMKRTGWSAAKWAAKANIAASTVQRAIKPGYEFVTSSRTLAKLAAAAGEAPPEVTEEAQSTTTPAHFLEIRYEVGAGLWRGVEDLSQSFGRAPVTESPAFRGFPQWMERVVSDSMDLEYPVGTLLHVVDAVPIHYSVRNADHVIVERTRESGGYVERTVKEVVITPTGVELWGRSRNPKWNRPINILDGQEDETTEVRIAALVLGSYRSRGT